MANRTLDSAQPALLYPRPEHAHLPVSHTLQPGPPGPGASPKSQTTLVVLLRYRPQLQWWGASRLVIGPRAWKTLPGLHFVKVLGSGFEAGFGVRPSLRYQGLFMVFNDESSALGAIDLHPGFEALREATDEMLCCVMQAHSMRGQWAGKSFQVSSEPSEKALVSITRASIRPHKAYEFWRRAPAAQRALEAAPGCLVAAGLGEAPLLRQMTFSIWENAYSMTRFAHSGAHQQAIEAAYSKAYFSESMFARYRLLRMTGQWRGHRYG